MYELILILMLGVAVCLTYFFACKIIVTNSMNSSPLFSNYYLKKEHPHPFLQFIHSTIMGLRDTESGFFAVLNWIASTASHPDKSIIGNALLGGKISQSLLVVALFLPIPYFFVFFALLLTISWINQRKISLPFVGILLGLLLMKISIEMFFYFSQMNHSTFTESIPGLTYLVFSQEHPWIFLINGGLVAAMAWNISFILPVILVLSVILKLTILQLLFMVMGLFLVFAIKYYVLALTARGIISEALKESFLFFVAMPIAISLTLITLYSFFPEILNTSMTPSLSLSVSLWILAIVTITVVLLILSYDFWKKILSKIFPRNSGQIDGYKYSRTLFKETVLGTQILKNELRNYSLEQLAYSGKSHEWLETKKLNNTAIEHIHNNFQKHFNELKAYLAILQKSDDILLQQEEANICTQFLEGAHALEANFYEKFKWLKMLEENQNGQEMSDFIFQIIEAEDAVFYIYEAALTDLNEEDIDTLFNIIDHKGTLLQKIEGAYVSSHENLTEAGHEKIALELVKLYQINLWLIGKQNEILKKWSVSKA